MPPPVFTVAGAFRETFAFVSRRPFPAFVFPLATSLLVALSQLIVIDSILVKFFANIFIIILFFGGMGAVAAAAADPDGIELSPAECLRVSFARTPGFLALMVFIFLVSMAAMIPLGIGTTFFRLMGHSSGGGIAFFVVISIAVVVFLSWLCVTFSLTIQAMVVEEIGPMAALSRSRELTYGNRLKIFIAYILASLLPGVALGWATYDTVQSGQILNPGIQFIALNSVVSCILNILIFSLFAIIYTNCASISASKRVNDFSEVF